MGEIDEKTIADVLKENAPEVIAPANEAKAETNDPDEEVCVENMLEATMNEGEIPDSGTEEPPADTNLDEVAEEPQDVKTGKKKRKKRKKRLKFYQITPENDIKYRGPLSYRALRAIGWACLFIAQIATIWSLVGKVDPTRLPSSTVQTILQMFGDMMMPLFLIATFATILNGSKDFRSMLMLYGGASVLLYLLFLLAYERWMVGAIEAVFNVGRIEAVQFLMEMLTGFTGGYLAFNLFIDLFLCTLLAFFLMYKPKKVFVGKKLLIFRWLAVLPILYEVASFTLKMLVGYGKIELSVYLYPLLTTKPPMTFIVFVVLTFFLKARERIYRKKGGTHEQYQAFLKTRANSWRVSGFIAKIMIVAGIVDLIIFIAITIVMTVQGLSTEALEAAEQLTGDAAASAMGEEIAGKLMHALDVLMRCGVGQSSGLILVAPIVLLFSYTRTHKDTKFDIILPIVAVVILGLMFIEGFYQVVKVAGGKLQDFINNFFGTFFGGGFGGE